MNKVSIHVVAGDPSYVQLQNGSYYKGKCSCGAFVELDLSNSDLSVSAKECGICKADYIVNVQVAE